MGDKRPGRGPKKKDDNKKTPAPSTEFANDLTPKTPSK